MKAGFKVLATIFSVISVIMSFFGVLQSMNNLGNIERTSTARAATIQHSMKTAEAILTRHPPTVPPTAIVTGETTPPPEATEAVDSPYPVSPSPSP